MNEFSEDKTLEILGARENNLKNIDLSIPRNAADAGDDHQGVAWNGKVDVLQVVLPSTVDF